jgi:hypothetical protein
MERPFNTEAQRRRNTGEGLNIGLKKFNRIARINRIVVF